MKKIFLLLYAFLPLTAGKPSIHGAMTKTSYHDDGSEAKEEIYLYQLPQSQIFLTVPFIFSQYNEYKNEPNIFDLAAQKIAQQPKNKNILQKNKLKLSECSNELYKGCSKYVGNVCTKPETPAEQIINQFQNSLITGYINSGEIEATRIQKFIKAQKQFVVNANLAQHLPCYLLLKDTREASIKSREHSTWLKNAFGWLSAGSLFAGGSLLFASPFFSEYSTKLQYMGLFFTGSCCATGYAYKHFAQKTTEARKNIPGEEALQKTMNEMGRIEKEAREKFFKSQQ